MVGILGIFSIFACILFYLISKQSKRDKIKAAQEKKKKLLDGVKDELYSYAFANEKIGKDHYVDTEGEGGYLEYDYNKDDKQKIYSLVDKYQKNILGDKYALEITVVTRKASIGFPFGEEATLINHPDFIIPFLKTEILKMPKGEDRYYQFVRRYRY
jgi:hypothetical protein